MIYLVQILNQIYQLLLINFYIYFKTEGVFILNCYVRWVKFVWLIHYHFVAPNINGSSLKSEHHDTIGNKNDVRVIRPQPIRPQHHNYRHPTIAMHLAPSNPLVGATIHEQIGLWISNGVMINTTLERQSFDPFRYVRENVIFLSC